MNKKEKIAKNGGFTPLESKHYKMAENAYLAKQPLTGFTLIEMLIVFTIMAILTTTFVLNFRVSAQTEAAKTQAASIVISDIRQAESMALSGARYQTHFICGYGIHYLNSITYIIYAKQVPQNGCANVATRNYDSGTDYLVDTKRIFSTNLEIRAPFSDIFFEPPNPTVYLNNDSALTGGPIQVIIQSKGQPDCSSQFCKYVNIYSSGRLDLL